MIDTTLGLTYKLHLGCGRTIMPGWINVDRVPLPGVDLVTDLETALFPYPENSVTDILGVDVLEHVQNILPLMAKLWVMAAPGARAIFHVPYGSSDAADEDPTHIRRFFLDSWGYFGQPYYWRADYGYRGDWQVEQIELRVDKATYADSTPSQVLADCIRYRNVVRQMAAQLIAVKPIREPRRELQKQYQVTVRLVD